MPNQKSEFFCEAVITKYEANEGGFADRAFEEERTAARAIERIFYDGIELYTRKLGPRGCMVFLSVTNCATVGE